MVALNPNTKIAAILKDKPEALEAIISISPRFNKLRNPLLRKLMASRTTIQMASRVGDCAVEDFFEKLRPLGFKVDVTSPSENRNEAEPLPLFMNNLDARQIVELDVRPVIEAGNDPLKIILAKIKNLNTGHVLKLINSFEPMPLIDLLRKQGFESYVETVDDDCVITYFNKTAESNFSDEETLSTNLPEFENAVSRFGEKIIYTDVSEMEMPQPMLTILDNLDKLPVGYALFVYHKRVPIFLIPELRERNFDYCIKEVSDTEVHLLIFGKES